MFLTVHSQISLKFDIGELKLVDVLLFEGLVLSGFHTSNVLFK